MSIEGKSAPTESAARPGDGSETAGGNRIVGVLRAYRAYWLTPIVLGLVLLGLTVVFADNDILGRFTYFNF